MRPLTRPSLSRAALVAAASAFVAAASAGQVACGGHGGSGATAHPTSSIIITAVEAPPTPEGDVALVVHLAQADLPSATVSAQVSANGAAFAAAHADGGAPTASGAATGEATVPLVWRSLKKVEA